MKTNIAVPKKSRDYTNEEWVDLLKHPADNEALRTLRSILVQNLKIVLVRIVIRERDEFIEDTVQEGLINILEHIETFRGESNFITWAQKVAVNCGYQELRKKYWENVSINNFLINHHNSDSSEEFYELTLVSPDPTPEDMAINRIYLEKVFKIIRDELTDKQRSALIDNKVSGIRPSVIADYNNTNRDVIYKRIYDAKKRIKDTLSYKYFELN